MKTIQMHSAEKEWEAAQTVERIVSASLEQCVQRESQWGQRLSPLLQVNLIRRLLSEMLVRALKPCPILPVIGERLCGLSEEKRSA